MKKVIDQVYQISAGAVNAFLIDHPEGLVLIDTANQGDLPVFQKAVQSIGKSLQDLQHIIVTHCHIDHAGALAALQENTSAKVYMHPLDAEQVRQGRAGTKEVKAGPGLVNYIIYHVLVKPTEFVIPAAQIDQVLQDGETLPIAGGLQVIHTPGHTAGHISLYMPSTGLLIAGDLCKHVLFLDESVLYEDRALGLHSIRKVLDYDFDKMVFGHGNPLFKNTKDKLRRRFLKS